MLPIHTPFVSEDSFHSLFVVPYIGTDFVRTQRGERKRSVLNRGGVAGLLFMPLQTTS